MNWKRGLARIYVVLWVLIAVAGGYFAWTSTSEVLQKKQALNELLATHKGTLTLQDLRELPLDSLQMRTAKRAVMFHGQVNIFPANTTDAEIREALHVPLEEQLNVVKTYDVDAAKTAGYTDDEIATYLVTQRDAGKALRVLTPISRGLFDAFRARGVTTEQIVQLSVGALSQDELQTMKDNASANFQMKLSKIWGLWVLVCGAAPLAFFLTLRWVITGFTR